MLNMKFEIKQNEYSVATKWRLCAAEAEKTIYIMMIYIKIVNLRYFRQSKISIMIFIQILYNII